MNTRQAVLRELIEFGEQSAKDICSGVRCRQDVWWLRKRLLPIRLPFLLDRLITEQRIHITRVQRPWMPGQAPVLLYDFGVDRRDES
jgi:hypothetical protein